MPKKISEWLADLDSHGIYTAEFIREDFKKETGQELPAFVQSFTEKQTRDTMKARGLGGTLKEAKNQRLMWGYVIASDFARHLAQFHSTKMGRGFAFRDCIEALDKGGL